MKLKDNEKNYFKSLPIEELLHHFSSQLDKDNKSVCPKCGSGTHENRTSALKINKDSNDIHCFSCKIHWDTFDLVQHFQGDFKSAVNWFRENYPYGSGNPIFSAASPPPPKKMAENKNFSKVYNFLLSQGSAYDNMPEPIKQYLTLTRGIPENTIKSWNIRYFSGDLRKRIPGIMKAKFPVAILLDSGIFARSKKTENIYYSLFSCHILFPFIDEMGETCHIQGKNESYPDNGDKYINLPHKLLIPYGIHILNTLNPGDSLSIVEGLFDTLTMSACGFKTIGIPGVTHFKKFSKFPWFKKLFDFNITGIFHNDKQGRELEKAAFKIFGSRINIKRLPEKTIGDQKLKDINEHYTLLDSIDSPKFKETIESLPAAAIGKNLENPPLDVKLDTYYNEISKHPPDQLKGYRLNRFPELGKGIDGVQPGFYIVGAESNIGKTAILINLFYDLVESNQDITNLKVLFFTLDDPINRIFNRIFSLITGIEIMRIDKRQKETHDQRDIEKAVNQVKAHFLNGRLDIIEENRIEAIKTAIEAETAKGNRLAIFIDGLHYIDLGENFNKETAFEEHLAESIKRLILKYNVPIISTAEVRKSQKEGIQDRRLTISDISGSKRLPYRADLVLLLTPDNQEEFENPNNENPLLRAYFAKNKLGIYKGAYCFEFWKYKVKLLEISENIKYSSFRL